MQQQTSPVKAPASQSSLKNGDSPPSPSSVVPPTTVESDA
jgi:hypothetical protein